jgi:transcriptional regulator with XRE-family HTH domain
MDHARLAAELVRHLRRGGLSQVGVGRGSRSGGGRSSSGGRSQVAVARRLGHRSNVVYAWEAGRRAPLASAFFDLAAKCRVQFEAGLTAFLGGPHAAPGNRGTDALPGMPGAPGAIDVPALVRTLRGQRTVSGLAREVGVTRLTVMRWLDGATEPRLPDLLRLVEVTTQRLLEFVALFADPVELPATRAAWADLQAQLRIAYELPWSHAVLRALELGAYARLPRHEPGFLAAQLGISREEEERCLAALERAGQIRWDGERWSLVRVIAVDTRRDPAGDRALKRHWARLGLERIDRDAGGRGLFSFNLFAVSAEDYERIREMHLAYYDEIRAVVAQSHRPERVVLTNLQLFPLDAGVLP